MTLFTLKNALNIRPYIVNLPTNLELTKKTRALACALSPWGNLTSLQVKAVNFNKSYAMMVFPTILLKKQCHSNQNQPAFDLASLYSAENNAFSIKKVQSESTQWFWCSSIQNQPALDITSLYYAENNRNRNSGYRHYC